MRYASSIIVCVGFIKVKDISQFVYLRYKNDKIMMSTVMWPVLAITWFFATPYTHSNHLLMAEFTQFILSVWWNYSISLKWSLLSMVERYFWLQTCCTTNHFQMLNVQFNWTLTRESIVMFNNHRLKTQPIEMVLTQ